MGRIPILRIAVEEEVMGVVEVATILTLAPSLSPSNRLTMNTPANTTPNNPRLQQLPSHAAMVSRARPSIYTTCTCTRPPSSPDRIFNLPSQLPCPALHRSSVSSAAPIWPASALWSSIPPASVGPAPPPHWGGQGHVPSAPYGDSRPRGGYQGRGGSKHSPGVRYEHEPPAVPVNGYAQPYPPPSQYYYSGPPPPPTQSSHRDGRHGHNNSHGRRGGEGNRGRGRGRGGHGSGDRGRSHHKPSNDHGGHHGQQKSSQQKQNQQSKQNQGQRELPIVGRKKKRKTNTLGLTPGMESETEDDEGEEEALVKLLGQEKFQVDDIAEFIAERKRNYPTKARREAKKAAEAAQKNEEKRTSLERQADKLRRQLRKVESSIKRKREQGDEGDEMRDPSSDESSDDDKPEEVSSRPPASNSAPTLLRSLAREPMLLVTASISQLVGPVVRRASAASSMTLLSATPRLRSARPTTGA
uniref:FMR1-interacting protein 1 conserved domain-containing protein n=1 Tax=Bionectria ochroleuca TaxID=29856 RepID=A0A8H7K9T9_BIOOC